MLAQVRKFISGIPVAGPMLRGIYRKTGGTGQPAIPLAPYEQWIAQRLADRSTLYPAPAANLPKFDILTLTYETGYDILLKTAESVFNQDYGEWRWIVLDNASVSLETQRALDEIAKHPRVVLHRHDKNLGITTGHLKALELCSSEYVVLLDHDDLLTSDAMRILAWHLDRFQRPDFMYSDEDKCDMELRKYYPYFKPDYSPTLLLNTAYTCHLAVAKLTRIRECGAFTDPAVEGTQDWDMALRLTESGGRVVHVPEILYTWRAVPQSTAEAGIAAKPYVIASQKHCVKKSLERRGFSEKFDVLSNPLFAASDGHWRTCRRREPNPPHINIVVISTESNDNLLQCLSSILDLTDYPRYTLTVVDATDSLATGSIVEIVKQKLPRLLKFDTWAKRPINVPEILNSILEKSADETEYIGCISPGMKLASSDWLWEALGLFEMNAQISMVGGRLFGNDHSIIGGPGVFGAGGVVGTYYGGSHRSEPGFACMNFNQHEVGSILNAPWVVRRADALKLGGFNRRFPRIYFEADFGARCHLTGKRVVYTPYIVSYGHVPGTSPEEEQLEISRFVEDHIELMRDDPYYSPFLSLSVSNCHQIASPTERAGYINGRLPHLRVDSDQSARFQDVNPADYEMYRYQSREATFKGATPIPQLSPP